MAQNQDLMSLNTFSHSRRQTFELSRPKSKILKSTLRMAQMAIFMENRNFEHFLSSKWLPEGLKGEISNNLETLQNGPRWPKI